MSDALLNAFWVFVGIVAGAFIQFGLSLLLQRQNNRNARRILRIEASINRAQLDRLQKNLNDLKDAVVSGSAEGELFRLDMSGFNYSMLTPLINSGHFHDILGAGGVEAYFRFANQLNYNNSQNLAAMLKADLASNAGLSFMRWLLETKMREWDADLKIVEERLKSRFD